MMNKQSQKGGDSSTNIQTEQMIVQVGIDEKRAREIYQEMNLQLKKDYTEEALKIANTRVLEFENLLMPKMESVEGALEIFADPSFQILLVDAQKTVASTERTADYELLSELLIHRFQRGENRIVRAGISRAVEIVDKISDDALIGLTAFHAVSSFLPSTGDIFQGIDRLDDLFGKILYGSLPSGMDWLDHLDILDAVRLSSFGGLKKIEQYYSEQLPGYVDAGIRKDSDDYNKALEILKAEALSHTIMVEHALNPNYVRIPVPDRQQIGSISLIQQVIHEGSLIQLPVAPSEEQKDAMNSVYDLYDKDPSIKTENIRLLIENIDKRKNLNTLKEWWNSLNVGIQITAVGKVLAHSNAQRCDKNLPPLN
ncbi:hypothetical protein KIH87_09755 [Paraneptunicella aestuarii]|uniref:LPO_1073/Vpar_1526 family protein n=1 Tax=Paraneptunicella aestuarii TaxID=2831148 RepID=UPI001E5801FA|nr:LPO_1073/Vpar_1526 family protein [Paraneptunicella aestuarii]UAA40596.1 hypothetical protein KIH87_09755 [Paraneptunicella aestuarii]